LARAMYQVGVASCLTAQIQEDLFSEIDR